MRQSGAVSGVRTASARRPRHCSRDDARRRLVGARSRLALWWQACRDRRCDARGACASVAVQMGGAIGSGGPVPRGPCAEGTLPEGSTDALGVLQHARVALVVQLQVEAPWPGALCGVGRRGNIGTMLHCERGAQGGRQCCRALGWHAGAWSRGVIELRVPLRSRAP